MVKSDLYLKPQLPPSARGIWRRTGKARYALLGAINSVTRERVTSGWESPVPWPLIITGQICEEFSKLLTHTGHANLRASVVAYPCVRKGLSLHPTMSDKILLCPCPVKLASPLPEWILCWSVEQLTKTLITALPDTLDPLQFTYRANRCTDGSITVILHMLFPTRSRRRHAGVCKRFLPTTVQHSAPLWPLRFIMKTSWGQNGLHR